jgi:hypothetical protein
MNKVSVPISNNFCDRWMSLSHSETATPSSGTRGGL